MPLPATTTGGIKKLACLCDHVTRCVHLWVCFAELGQFSTLMSPECTNIITYFNEIHQNYSIPRTLNANKFSRSLVKRSRPASNNHWNLVNLIAPEPNWWIWNKTYTNISWSGHELVSFLRSWVKGQSQSRKHFLFWQKHIDQSWPATAPSLSFLIFASGSPIIFHIIKVVDS